MQGISIDRLQIGQQAAFSKTISEADVYMFAGITGDVNPVHIDEVFARATMFGGRIAHGMLTASLISTVLGMFLPGPGTVLLKQDFKYLAPVKFGDTITATCTVKEITADKNRVLLTCAVTNQDGKAVLTGESLCMPPKAG